MGWEDPPEKEMATHSSVLAWRIPWAEEPDALYPPWGHKELDMTERLKLSLSPGVPSHSHFGAHSQSGLGCPPSCAVVPRRGCRSSHVLELSAL